MEGSSQPTNPAIRRAREVLAGARAEGEAAGTGKRAELRGWVTEIATRIEEIIDAAERAADEIRSHAEREAGEIRAGARRDAQTYLDERMREADDTSAERLRSLEAIGKPLLERAERLSAELAGAAAELDRAMSRTAELGASSGRSTPSPSNPSEPLVELASGDRSSEPPPAEPAAPDSRSSHDRAVLRATQLAVLGRDKAEIEAALRDEFELADPAAVVDSILGPE